MTDELEQKPEPPASETTQSIDSISDEFHHEAKMHYSADPGFAAEYHHDAYNPETYHYHKSIFESIQNYLDRFVITNPQYDALRSIDCSKLRAGDNVGYNPKDTEVKYTGKVFNIVSIEDDVMVIVCDGLKFETTIADIKIIDEPISRLKAFDLSFIYNDFKKNTKTDSHVDFFHIFTEYFKINEKQLYESLPHVVKNEILVELDEKTGCLSKMNTFHW